MAFDSFDISTSKRDSQVKGDYLNAGSRRNTSLAHNFNSGSTRSGGKSLMDRLNEIDKRYTFDSSLIDKFNEMDRRII